MKFIDANKHASKMEERCRFCQEVNHLDGKSGECINCDYPAFILDLKAMTEDIVRCQNCKYADKTEREGEYRCCFHPEEIVIADFYCGDGKAK